MWLIVYCEKIQVSFGASPLNNGLAPKEVALKGAGNKAKAENIFYLVPELKQP